MKTIVGILPAPLQTAAEGLAASLLLAEPIAAYHRAKIAFESSAEAQSILAQLSKAQTELRTTQFSGEVTQADLARVRELSQQARNNPLVVDYLTTQRAAADYLAEVNQEISRLLGVDFTALASSGCC